MALLLLGPGARYWLHLHARGLAETLPQIAAQLDAATIEKIGRTDTPGSNPAYKATSQQLAALERRWFPERGHHLSIVVVDGDREAKIVEPDDADDQISAEVWFPAEPYALDALGNKVSYSPAPYTTHRGDENITAYAPIADKSGKVPYLLTVDYDTSSLADTLRVVRFSFLAAVVPAVVISLAFAALLSRRFVDPFDLLRTLHEAIPRRARPAPPHRAATTDETGAPTPAGSEPAAPASSPSGEGDAVTPRSSAPVAAHSETSLPLDSRWASLTPRERETVALSHLKYKEIAARMHISVEGVKKHLQNARAKLGTRDRVELALYAVRMGALEGDLSTAPTSEDPI